MATVGTLIFEMSANVARLQQDMGRAQSAVKSFADSAKRLLEGIGLGISIAGVAEWTKHSIEAADQAGKTAQKIGMSTEAFTGWSYAAKLADVDQTSFAQGAKKLTETMLLAAAGTVQQQGALRALGINMKDVRDGSVSTDQVMYKLADRVSQMRDGWQKTALVAHVLGARMGTDLIPLLNQGSEAIRAQIEEGKRLGVVYGDDVSSSAQEANDALTRVSAVFQSVSIQAAKGLSPSITEISNAFVELAATKDGTVGFFDVIGEAMRITAMGAGTLWLSLKDVGDSIGAMAAKTMAWLHGDTAAVEAITKERAAQAQKLEEENIKLVDSLRKHSMIFGDGKTPEPPKRPKPAGGGVDTSGMNTAGVSFLRQLQQQIETADKGEYAMLRLKAAQLGVAQAAEPLIEKLQGLKDAKADAQRLADEWVRNYQETEAARKAVDDFKVAQEQNAGQIEFQTSLLGKTALQQQQLTAARQVDLEVQRQMVAAGEGNVEQMAALMSAGEEAKKRMEDVIQANYEAARSWQTGLAQGMHDYIDSVTDAASQAKKLFTDAFQGMEDALVAFVTTGKLDFKSLVDSIVADIARIQIKKTLAPLEENAAGWLSNMFGAIFGGGKASGGPVTAGTPYLVGEAGPELFVPGASGSIVPNGGHAGEAAGGSGPVVNINISAIDVVSFAQRAAQIKGLIVGWTREAWNQRGYTTPIG